MKHLLFLLSLMALSIPASALGNGVYIIRSAVNQNYVLEFDCNETQRGGNIRLWEFNGSPSQSWLLVNLSGGNIILAAVERPDFNDKNINTWHVLDLKYGKINKGNNIQLWEYNNTSAQYWYLDKNQDDTYTICSTIDNNFVVDLMHSHAANGTNIQLWESNGTKAQKWIFAKIEPF